MLNQPINMLNCKWKKWSTFFFVNLRFGWVDEQIAVVPRVQVKSNCGNGKTGVVVWRADPSREFDAFCFNLTGKAFCLIILHIVVAYPWLEITNAHEIFVKLYSRLMNVSYSVRLHACDGYSHKTHPNHFHIWYFCRTPPLGHHSFTCS